MSRYYKGENVINAIEDKIAEYIPTLYGRYGEIPLELRMAIESLPTIDIVHCGECKCCRDELIEEHMPLYIYCEKWNHETDFDGFCSAGERIDNE